MKEGPFEIFADVKQFNNTLDALVSIIYAKVKSHLFVLSSILREIDYYFFSM